MLYLLLFSFLDLVIDIILITTRQRPLKAIKGQWTYKANLQIVISLNLSNFHFSRKCITKDDYFCIAYLLLSSNSNLNTLLKALKRPIEYGLNVPLLFEFI